MRRMRNRAEGTEYMDPRIIDGQGFLQPGERLKTQGMTFRIYAGQDQGSRNEQQDQVAASLPEYQEERGILCVLSDGMGGLQEGKTASETVVDTMIECFYDSPVTMAPGRVMLKGCAEAQRRVLALQNASNDRGATLAATLIRDGRCSFLSVGDSRILLYRGGGLIQLTRDMNKGRRIETQVALGILPPEARTDWGKRHLNAFIGQVDLEKVDRSAQSFQLIPGDRLLLISDGVYESLSQREMEEVASMTEESLVTGTMIDRVLAAENPNQDNCSILMVQCASGDQGGRMGA